MSWRRKEPGHQQPWNVYKDIMQPLRISFLCYWVCIHPFAFACHQRHLCPPLERVVCVETEVLLNITNLPRHLCIWHCMHYTGCEVMTYNVVTRTCSLGRNHCVSLLEKSNVITTLVTVQEPCVPPDNSVDKNTSSSGPPPPPPTPTIRCQIMPPIQAAVICSSFKYGILIFQ